MTSNKDNSSGSISYSVYSLDGSGNVGWWKAQHCSSAVITADS